MSSASEVFESFIESVREICAQESPGETRWQRASDHLRTLVANPEFREESMSWPAARGQELILHHDEEHGFFVGGLVRIPNHEAYPHDHGHTWTCYGVLYGDEVTSLYKRLDDGSEPGKARVEKTVDIPTPTGMVDIVGPWRIHAESGAGERSVAITLRSEIPGTYNQNLFDMETDTVRHGRGLLLIPFPIGMAKVSN